MALVTYILLSTLLAGLRGQFQPELLGYTASKAGVVVILELMALKLGCYFLSISNESQLLDLVAYSGYKFVGIIATVALSELVSGGKGTGGWFGWIVFLYTFLANSLFLVRACACPRAKLIIHVSLSSVGANQVAADAVSAIRAASGEHRECPGAHADGHPDQAEPADPVLVLLLVHHPVPVHVGSHLAGEGRERKEKT